MAGLDAAKQDPGMGSHPSTRSTSMQGAMPRAELCSGVFEGFALAMLGIVAYLLSIFVHFCCTTSSAAAAVTASMLQGHWVLPSVLAIDPVLFVLLKWEHYSRVRGVVSIFQRLLLLFGIGHASHHSSSWFGNFLWTYRVLLSHLGCALAHIPERWYWTGALLSWLAAMLTAEAPRIAQPAHQGFQLSHSASASPHMSGTFAAVMNSNSAAGNLALQVRWCIATLTSRSGLMYLAQVLIPGLLLRFLDHNCEMRRPSRCYTAASGVRTDKPASSTAITKDSAATERGTAARAGALCRSTRPVEPTNDVTRTSLPPGTNPADASIHTAAANDIGPASRRSLKRGRGAVRPDQLASSPSPFHTKSPVQIQAVTSRPTSAGVPKAPAAAILAPTPLLTSAAAFTEPYAGSAGAASSVLTTTAVSSSTQTRPPVAAVHLSHAAARYPAAAAATAASIYVTPGRTPAPGLPAWRPHHAGPAAAAGSGATAAAAGTLAAGFFLHPIAAALHTPAAGGRAGLAPAELCVDSRYVEQLQELNGRSADGCFRVVIVRQPQGAVLLDQPWHYSQQSQRTTAGLGVAGVPSMIAEQASSAATTQATAATTVAQGTKPQMPVPLTPPAAATAATQETAAAAAALAQKLAVASSTSTDAPPPQQPQPQPPASQLSPQPAQPAAAAAASCQVLSVMVLLNNSSVVNCRGGANIIASAAMTTPSAADDSAVAPTSSSVLTQLPLLVLPAPAQQELQQLFDAMVRSGMHPGDAYQQLLPLLHSWALLVLINKEDCSLLSVLASSAAINGGSASRRDANITVSHIIMTQQQVFDVAFAAVSGFLVRHRLVECQTFLNQVQQVRRVCKQQALRLLQFDQLSDVAGSAPPSAVSVAAAAAVPAAVDGARRVSLPLGMTSNASGSLVVSDGQGGSRLGRKLVHVRRSSTASNTSAGTVAAFSSLRNACNKSTGSSSDISISSISKGIAPGLWSGSGSSRSSGKGSALGSSDDSCSTSSSFNFTHRSSAAFSSASGKTVLQKSPAAESSTCAPSSTAHTTGAFTTGTSSVAAVQVAALSSTGSCNNCVVGWRSVVFGFADAAAAESYARYKAGVLQHHDFLAMIMWLLEAALCCMHKLLKVLGWIGAQSPPQGSIILLLTMVFKVMFVGIAATFHGLMWLAAAYQHQPEPHQNCACSCHNHNQQQQQQQQQQKLRRQQDRVVEWKLRVQQLVQLRDAALMTAATTITLTTVGCYFLGGIWSSALAQVMQGLHSSLLLYGFFNCVVQPLLFRVRPAAVLTYCTTLAVQSALFPPPYAAGGIMKGVVPCVVVAGLVAVSLSVTCWLEQHLQQSFAVHARRASTGHLASRELMTFHLHGSDGSSCHDSSCSQS